MVGFMIKPGAQRKGYASEALGVLASYAFEVLGLQKLLAVCSTDNIGCCKTLEKSGFIREQLRRGKHLIHGEYQDDYLYGLRSVSV